MIITEVVLLTCIAYDGRVLEVFSFGIGLIGSDVVTLGHVWVSTCEAAECFLTKSYLFTVKTRFSSCFRFFAIPNVVGFGYQEWEMC